MHDLTKRSMEWTGFPGQLELWEKEVLLPWLREKSKEFKDKYNMGFNPETAVLMVDREGLHEDIDEAFGLEEKTLEDKFKDCIKADGYSPYSPDYYQNLIKIAKEHYKQNPNELDK